MCFVSNKKFEKLKDNVEAMLNLILDSADLMSRLEEKLNKLDSKMQEFHPENSPPPDGEEPWMGWWDLSDITEAPTRVYGQKVAYVVLDDDHPLITFDRRLKEDGTLMFVDIRTFQSQTLRPNSNPDNKTSMRIVAKGDPRILMVYASGNEYDLSNHPWYDGGQKDVRPFKGDGGNDIFIVMKENYEIDGVNLMENDAVKNVELGVYSRHIKKIVHK